MDLPLFPSARPLLWTLCLSVCASSASSAPGRRAPPADPLSPQRRLGFLVSVKLYQDAGYSLETDEAKAGDVVVLGWELGAGVLGSGFGARLATGDLCRRSEATRGGVLAEN